jgi:hypothetical protein
LEITSPKQPEQNELEMWLNLCKNESLVQNPNPPRERERKGKERERSWFWWQIAFVITA